MLLPSLEVNVTISLRPPLPDTPGSDLVALTKISPARLMKPPTSSQFTVYVAFLAIILFLSSFQF